MRGIQRDVAHRENLRRGGEWQRFNHHIWMKFIFVAGQEQPLCAPWSFGSCAVAHQLVLETTLSNQSQRSIVVSETRGAGCRRPCAFGLACLQRGAKRCLASYPRRGAGSPGSQTWQVSSYGGTSGLHSDVCQADMNSAGASSMVSPAGRSHRRAASRRLVSRIRFLAVLG